MTAMVPSMADPRSSVSRIMEQLMNT